ncbi:pilin [Streptomyces sp. Rer75]|uniref:pilin n=1 Tax=Streptomyces sp. Rer75 TaxID=2750011 RepID=UPI0027BA8F4C|nr:pilin [Streptomyces sp. Rer75]
MRLTSPLSRRCLRDRAARADHGDRQHSTRRLTTWAGRFLLIVSLVIAVSILLTSAAQAEPVQVQALAKSINTVLDNLRNWVMGILAGLATLFLTVGGVRYIVAAGDPGEVEKAKSSFKSAGYGYGLATLAPLVVEIFKGIVGA